MKRELILGISLLLCAYFTPHSFVWLFFYDKTAAEIHF